MTELYTSAPANVPESLTLATPNYKKKVTIAFIGLLAFITIYLVLMIWFGRLAYRLFLSASTGVGNTFLAVIVGVFMIFLFIFMLKSLFIFKKNVRPEGHELKSEDEPALFEFLYKLADEAKAPRPHKVFLSDRVNACVFYELSLFNLFYPSKKNLEIGLGLVNVLNVGEFKAVLAHEFGHFAQKSMLLGRYVYMAQQIAVRVVNKRDAFDGFISGLSRIDLRVAWIGWILSILVWAIRSVIEILFRSLSVLEKAVSREMEFQADLVAVSLTGSDALINALSKLRAADEAYGASLGEINTQLGKNKAVRDLYALQSAYIEKMRWVLDDEAYGCSPDMSKVDASTRIFNKGIANPPEMWATHPNDNDRENNAKAIYIPAEINPNSSWLLFTNAQAKREGLTKELIDTAKLETELLTNEEAVSSFTERYFNLAFLNPEYKGLYLRRSPFLNFKNASDMYDASMSNDLKAELQNLYPVEITYLLEQHNEINEEIHTLKAIQNEVMTAEKRVIMHRGEQIRRSDIKDILEELVPEELKIRQRIIDVDKKCRTVSYDAAISLNPAVGEYLMNLSKVVHYTEHCMANLADSRQKLDNTLSVALADGRVSDSEWNKIYIAGSDIDNVLSSIYGKSKKVVLSLELEKRFGQTKYEDLFETYNLGSLSRENFNKWYEYLGGWSAGADHALNKLRNTALELLLEVEEEVKEVYLGKKSGFTIQPGLVSVPDDFKLLMPGEERELTLKLGAWDRFQVGDGIVPMLAKLAVAASLVGVAVYVGKTTQYSSLAVYNGLEDSVEVTINGNVVDVAPHSHKSLDVDYDEEFNILTMINEDTVEQFSSVLSERSQHIIYNVANSAAFVEYTVTYGYDSNEPNDFIGAQRIFTSSAEYVFEEPPTSLNLKRNRTARRTVLQGLSEYSMNNMASFVDDEEELTNLAVSHAIWGRPSSPNTLEWIGLASQLDKELDFITKRLSIYPEDVMAHRALMDYGSDEQREKACAYVEQASAKDPDNGNYFYLKTRCVDGDKEKDDLFLEGQEKWPDNPWLNFASSYTFAGRGDWNKSYDSFSRLVEHMPSMASNMAMDIDAVRQMSTSKHKAVEQFLSQNENIKYLRNIKDGIIKDNQSKFDQALLFMHQGSFQKSLNALSLDKEGTKALKWFHATSVGANKNIRSEVLNFSTEDGVTYATAPLALGLKVKENRSYTAFLDSFASLLSLEDHKDEISQFIDQVKQGNYTAADKTSTLISDDFRINSKFYLLAYIIKGNNIPAAWRDQIDKTVTVFFKPKLD